MTRSTNAPRICPRGCGFTDAPHRVAMHERRCLTPRTIARLVEIGGAVRDGSCLLWRGSEAGSGQVKGQRPYVVAFEIAHGPLPPGMEVCHRCDRPGCIEPSHLFAGTHADNIRDCASKGRLGGWASRPEASARKRWDRVQSAR